MSDLQCEKHDWTVIQDGDSHCSHNKSKMRGKRRGNKRDRRRGKQKESRRGTRQNDASSPMPGDNDDRPQHFVGTKGVHESQEDFQWPALPNDLLKYILKCENSSWIEDTGGGFDNQTLFQRFTEDAPDASPGMIQEVKEVSVFCGSHALQDLELGLPRIHLAEVYLDDRTTEGCRSDRQRRPGPMTVRQLYLELKKERFPLYDLHCAKDEDTVGVNSNLVRLAQRQNADRRVIFQTDLNPWGAMALVSTASKREALKVYGMVYRHLTFESFIGIRKLGSNSSPFYQFAFDIPYYTWRITKPDMRPDDAQSRGRDKPLRNVEDLSFLSTKRRSSSHTSPTDYLCEAHTSVLISTIDSRRFIIYALVDAYFDDEEKRENAKASFNDPDIDSDGDSDDDGDSYVEHVLETDPLTKGNFDANTPIQDPWRYFWAALTARIEVVEGEWRTVVGNAKDRIKTYIDSAQLDYRSFPHVSSEEHCAWISQTKTFLGVLIETLEALIKDWKQFELHEAFSKDAVDRELSNVRESFQRLEKYARKLKCLQTDCNNFSEVVTLYMAAEGTGIAKYGVTAAVVMLLIHGPLSISSGIYSMQADAIPHFLGPTKLSYVGLTGSLGAAMLFVFLLIHFRYMGPVLWRTYFQFKASTKG